MYKKNWTFYATTDNVFWDANTTDKPSLEYIENMNWQEIDLNLHHISPYLVRTQLNSDQYGLIKAVNKTTNKEIYYILKNIVMFTDDNYNLEYELDTWTTYNLKMLDLDINVLADRHQDYDDENCLKFDDEKLSALELNFKTIKRQKIGFNEQIINNEIVFSNNNKKIVYKNKKDIINSHYCLVINDNDVTDYSAYTFIPILGFTQTQFISNTNVSDEYILNITAQPNVQSTVRQMVYFWIECVVDKKLINWFYDQITNNNDVKVEIICGNYKKDISNLFKSTKIENLYVLIIKSKNLLTSIKIFDCENHVNGFNELFLKPYSGKTIFEENVTYGWLSEPFLKFTSNSSAISNYDFLDNSLLNINKIIKSQNYANKINGIYVIPNIMNLTDCWSKQTINNSDVLTLKIEQQGAKLESGITLIDNVKIGNKLEFNSKIPLNKIIYKFYKCNWLNNEIDLSHFIVNDKVWFRGVINFTNSFNIIHDNDSYLLENRIFTLPAQQPLKSDTYNKYVQANMNSVNTGYAIQKQQSMISGFQGLFSSLTSGLIGSAISANPLGAISGVAGGVNSVGGSILNVKNYEKQMRSKYADANNVRGNELIFSATRDNLWSHLLTDNDQFEAVMIKELTDDSIIQLNNTLLLNGVYNPKYFKLNDLPKTTKHLGFYYAKLNTTNFNQVFSKHINETREIKDIILANFAEFRVWDKIPSIE